MRAPRPFVPDPRSPRLARRTREDRTELFTEASGAPPPVYGERWVSVGSRAFRSFEPSRSKLSAALVHGWTGPLPVPGDSWLYLGAASGTTASHLSDLVGPDGSVYAVERSPRSFARLLSLGERWPNLLPVLADARAPRTYSRFVPPVHGLYADVAQADQVEIVRRNAELYLRGPTAALLIALKTASMGRDREAPAHLAAAERALRSGADLAPSVRLDPFHKGHYFLGGRARPELFGGAATRPVTLSRGPRPARRRP